MAAKKKKKTQSITTSSTAEYFSKNLQQVGFSSPTKAVLTTLKEAFDNSLDACEDAGILPELHVEIEKKGAGTLRNTDSVAIIVEDNGPGLELDDVAKVFGEYLASSKFGRGRCSRGQQGIGISAATTWAQLTSARGATVTTKTDRMRQAAKMLVEVDIKNNKGVLKNKETLAWNKPHGVRVEFRIDGRIQIHGEGGLLTYLLGNTLVNPHLKLSYKLPGMEKVITIDRVSNECPSIPAATEPHPHTMKLGEFIAHSHLFGKKTVRQFLKSGFSRISDKPLADFVSNGLDKKILDQSISKTTDAQLKEVYSAIHKTDLMSPSTRSVMTIGEDSFSKSVRRMGEVDFFSVVTRKPKICDFKPIAVEVAVARLKKSGAAVKPDGSKPEDEGPVSVLRFANRVPLQFDKSACAMFKAVQTVHWRTYGINQPKGSLPLGPYIIAVSLVSPFIKFKNASKETVDASDELLEELRRALIQAGQRLSRHIKKEARELALEQKTQHIEQFCPILVDCLIRITNSSAKRKKAANEGLIKILGREVSTAEKELQAAEDNLAVARAKGKVHVIDPEDIAEELAEEEEVEDETSAEEESSSKKTKKSKAKSKAKAKTKPPTKVPTTKTPTKKAAKATTKKKTKKATKSKRALPFLRRKLI